jgi:hypothetical protein
MKKKDNKRVKQQKTLETRENEIESLMDQFMGFGFPLDNDGVQEFIKVAKDFEMNGVASSGKINLPGFQRVISYIFSMQPHVESRIVLEHNKHI